MMQADLLSEKGLGLRGTCPRFPTGRHVGQWESSDMSEQSMMQAAG